MNVLNAISDFQLDLLPTEWVDLVASKDFSGEKEIPDEYTAEVGNINFSQFMLQLIEALKSWKFGDDRESICSSRSDSPSVEVNRKSWKTLLEYKVDKVDPKPLLCLLSTFIKSDIKELKDGEMVNLWFLACRLYLELLAIPGSMAFNVFNSILFDQALGILRIGSVLKSSESEGSKQKKQSKAKKNSKSKKKGKNNEEAEEEGDMEEEENADNSQSSVSLADIIDKKEVFYQINQLLDDLSDCLKVLPLREEAGSVDFIIQLLVCLTTLETDSNIFVKKPLPNTVGHIALKSYSILEELCVSEHGEIEEIVLTIMSCILPNVVFNDQNMGMSGKRGGRGEKHAFTFIQRLLVNVGEPAAPGVKALVQQMCVRMPDRSDVRAKAASDIVNLIQPFPPSVFQDIVVWIISFAHEEVVKYRSTATEIIAKLLNVADNISEVEGEGPRNNTEQNESLSESWTPEKGLLQKLLIAVVLSRCQDISPIVRAKCLGIFSGLLSTNQAQIRKFINDMLYNTNANNESEEKELFDFATFFKNAEGKVALPPDPLPSGTFLIRCIERLAHDEKVHVRKNALNVISVLCLVHEGWITPKRIQMLVKGCRDYSVLSRKLLSKCLTDLLLNYPKRMDFVSAWVQAVLPLVSDNEVKCQEKVIEYAGNVILGNLTDYNETENPLGQLPWLVIAEIAKQEKRSLFKFVCRSWALQNTIKKEEFNSITSHFGTENNNAAWFFIVCLSEFHDLPFARIIYDYYIMEVHTAKEIPEDLSRLVIEALFLNWRGLSGEIQEELYSQLRNSLQDYLLPIPLIPRSLDICYQINKSKTMELCETLIESGEDYVREKLAAESSKTLHDEGMVRQLVTLADALQYRPGTSTDVIGFIANMVAPGYICDETIEIWEGHASDRVRAVGVVTLGKICLQDDVTAKTFIQIIASLLKQKELPDPIKINSMVALADMCVRFTSVVEYYLNQMCCTLKDNSIDVRKNTLLLLTQLIQEDYLKVRVPLVFYLLYTLIDISPFIRELAESLLVNRILSKNTNIMAQYFIQAIFFYNNYAVKGGTTNYLKEFVGSGSSYTQRRYTIYRFMLRYITDDHRFKVSNRLAIDILEAAVEGKIDISNERGMDVVSDALFAMSCNEMRLEKLRKDDEEKEQEKEQEKRRENCVLGIARKVILTQVLRKNYIDNIIPVMLKLKPLIISNEKVEKMLVAAMRELMKDYKEEVDELLASDPELAKVVLLQLRDEEETLYEEFEHEDLDVNEWKMECVKVSEIAIADAYSTIQPALSGLVIGDEDVSATQNGSAEISSIAESSKADTASVTVNSRAGTASVTESSNAENTSVTESSMTEDRNAEDNSSAEKETRSPSMSLPKSTPASCSAKSPRKSRISPLEKESSGDETKRSCDVERENEAIKPGKSSKKRRSHEAMESSSQGSDTEVKTHVKKKSKSKRRK